jgi:CMP-N-acetylneuraminic acid synthetase
LNNSNIIAVIPARSGSRRIKDKNLQMIGGNTLIELACLAIPQYVTHTILSTDSSTVAHIGKQHGIEIIRRPPSLSTGFPGSAMAVWQHALLASDYVTDFDFDCSILLQPSTPTRNQMDISRCVDAIIDGKWDSAATVSPVPDRWAPHKQVQVRGGKISLLEKRHIPVYSRDGACFAANSVGLWDFYGNCAGIESTHTQVNIDEPLDLAIARHVLGSPASSA